MRQHTHTLIVHNPAVRRAITFITTLRRKLIPSVKIVFNYIKF